jgi:ribosomal protein S4
MSNTEAPRGEPTRFEFTIEDGGAERLDLIVARELDTSRTQAATLIANGNVTVNGKREKASFRADRGNVSVIVLVPPPVGRDIEPNPFRSTSSSRTNISSSSTNPLAWSCIRLRATGAARW